MNAFPDIIANNHGTIWLLHGATEDGKQWLADHVAFEQYFGNAGVVEWRYVQDIVNGAIEDGLIVKGRQP
jgi:hypothetical protein